MMVQVARAGSHYTVLIDGVANGTYYTRQSAIEAAIAHREALDPVRLN